MMSGDYDVGDCDFTLNKLITKNPFIGSDPKPIRASARRHRPLR